MLKLTVVFQHWARFLATIGLAAAMLGAPCRNCAPREDPKPHCGHDCCPKPKPGPESTPCSWQPAGFDAIEKSRESFSPDWQAAAFLPLLVESGALAMERPVVFFLDDRPPPQAPPASLTPLRI